MGRDDYVVRDARLTPAGQIEVIGVDGVGQIFRVTVSYQAYTSEHLDPLIRHYLQGRRRIAGTP